MLEEKEFMPIGYIKKQKWTGSYQGMRFMFRPVERVINEEQSTKVLEASVWREPFSFEATPEEEKIYQDFDLSEEGRQKAIAWITKVYEEHEEEYKAAREWQWKR